jgi:hypothetical protein
MVVMVFFILQILHHNKMNTFRMSSHKCVSDASVFPTFQVLTLTKLVLPYKPECKATPYLSSKKIRKEKFSFTKLNMSFSSEGCKQKQVKTILSRNN